MLARRALVEPSKCTASIVQRQAAIDVRQPTGWAQSSVTVAE